MAKNFLSENIFTSNTMYGEYDTLIVRKYCYTKISNKYFAKLMRITASQLKVSPV